MTTITQGPFKGLIIAEEEVRPLLDYTTGLPILRDGKPVMVWGVHHRTRHFLEKYALEDGWTVCVTHESGPFDIPDPSTLVEGRSGGMVPALQPTVIFKAELINAEDRVVANATLLKVINARSSWQAGQTAARGALYDALGLSYPEGHEESQEPDAGISSSESSSGSAQVHAVEPIQGPKRSSKLTQFAQHLVDADNQPSKSKEGVRESAESPVKTEAEVAVTKDDSGQAPPAGKPIDEVKEPASSDDSCVLNSNLLRQAKARAKLLGVEVPEFSNQEALRAFYKQLVSGSIKTQSAKEAS